MNLRSVSARSIVGLICIGGALAASAADRPLDDGRLDPAWFAGVGEFREADEIDYLWVRPGFSLDGKKIRFVDWPEPPEPAFLGPQASERDTKDQRLAQMINAEMPEVFATAFRNAFGDRVAIVEEGEDLRAEGRIVDCSTGSTAAKVLVGFGAGSGNTTLDLKLVDAASGEAQLAIHHRAVSGTTWSTTDSKIVEWADETAEAGAKKGFDKLYAKGDRVRD
jgi:hypothetical protein